MSSRGKKRTCTSCGNKFYDLNRDPVICPACGKALTKVTAIKAAPPPAPEPDEEEEDELLEDDMDSDDTVDESDDILEDASDLGEDNEDLGEVMEHLEDTDKEA